MCIRDSAGTAGSTQAISFSGSAPVNSVVLDSTGPLLLGHASSVDGNFLIQANAAASQLRGIGVNNAGGYGVYLTYDNTTRYGGAAAAIRNIANSPLVFETNNSEKMRLDASGNLGLGVTPSSWSVGKAIEVYSKGNALISTSSTQAIVTSNAYYNTSWKYGASGAATYYQQNAGVHSWHNATAGTQDANITFTQAMTLDQEGRLLVGTPSARTNIYNASYAPILQVETTGTLTQRTASFTYNNGGTTGGGPVIQLITSRSATAGGVTLVGTDDELGSVQFFGTNGTAPVAAASITTFSDGAPSSTSMPGRLVFGTTAASATSPTTRFTINRVGDAVFSNTSAVYPATDNAATIGGSSNRWSAVYAVNGTIQTSDQRAKTDIADAQLGSAFIKSLRPVSYKWIEGGKRDSGQRDEENNYIYESVPGQRTHWGFIAQEVKQAVDDAGVDFGGWLLTDKDDPDSQQALRYDQFIAPLTKALQEALAKIETLEAKVAALEAA